MNLVKNCSTFLQTPFTHPSNSWKTQFVNWWFAFACWSSACHWHRSGWCSAWWWHCQARSCSHGRSRLGRCSTEEGAQVSRVGGAWSQITPRGSRGRGRWQIFCRNDWLLGHLGKGEIPWCSALVAQEGGVVGHGASDGDRFCHVRQRVLWHLHCWNSHVRPVLMVKHLPRTRLSVTCM